MREFYRMVIHADGLGIDHLYAAAELLAVT